MTEQKTKEEKTLYGSDLKKAQMQEIILFAKKKLPMNTDKFIALISYKYGFTISRVRIDFLNVLLQLGIIKSDNNYEDTLSYIGIIKGVIDE